MSGRKRLVAGNWKLHKGLAEARAFAEGLRGPAGDEAAHCDVVIAPVFTALSAVHEALAGAPVGLAGQDVYAEASGAFTGEVSAPLLADVGATHCVIGHSERRQLFGERDEDVAKKLSALLAAGIAPIVCVGETLTEREAGETFDVVLRQLGVALGDHAAEALESVIIAYEPVWAIGTGNTASPSDAQEVHARIRASIAASKGKQLAERTRILYGGSVKPDNARELFTQPDVDGALVGGASLELSPFLSIVRAASSFSRDR